jgi:lambda repressor-like predicted transcriptional regulator
MHPELIKAAIRMKGTTPTSVARDLGVTHTCVAHVIAGRGTSERVSKRISEVTGIAVDVLWPPKAQPVLRGRPRKNQHASQPLPPA